MKINKILLLILLLGTFCGHGQQVYTLLTNLEDPRALCLDNGKVYFTETAGASNPFGGRVSLLEYKVNSGQTDTLVHQLFCSNAIVVDTTGKIFLGSEVGPAIGELGWVSQYVPASNADTIVRTVEIATHDMRLNPNGDILLVGMGGTSNSKSIYRFDGGDVWGTPTILQTGQGLVTSIVQHDSTVYFSTDGTINFFGLDGAVHPLDNQQAISIDYFKGDIYYADINTGTIGRISISTEINTTLVSGLRNPINLRIDPNSEALYFLESGTSTSQFLDGTLKVMDLGYLYIGDKEAGSVSSLDFYPNPVTEGSLTIANLQEGLEVTITDVQGRAVHYTHTTELGVIDVSAIPSGVYLIQVHSEEGQSVKRVVIR